ncbi:MAG: molybdopterin molybdotransferase MoeA [Bacteroidetes bacterium]|nr:molybdopterin molybdotransferase MoeA [Bacteroidota bacterium]
MISVEEAKKAVVEASVPLSPIQHPAAKALHFVLAEDALSPTSYPPFHQSAMDGFAFVYADYAEKKPIEIIGEAPAGIPFKEKVLTGTAVRVFTGAKIPEGTDTVVMQEKVSVENGQLIIQDAALKQGVNVRQEGLQIKKGEVALEKGIVLNAGAIGYLTSLGITSVNVYPKPRVSIIVTGSELQKQGRPLEDGQVYESNSFSLIAALASIHITPTEVITIGDEEKQTTDTLRSAIANSDIVLVSGGISVGKYDFVGKCLEELNVENIFYKIYQRPGKPLFFGKQNNCLIFALPGNPASVLSCFYEYVLPSLKIMQGFTEVFLKKLNLPLSADFNKKEGLGFFLKAKIINGKAAVLSGQESNNIGAFAFADCIIYLPASKGNVKAEELVEVHLLP